MSHRAALLVAVPAAVFGATGLRACLPAEHWPGPRGPQPIASASAVELGASIPPPAPPGAHPRILLTPDRLATMRGLRDGGASSWRRLVARCDDDVHEAIPSGYEAWDWSNATLDLALCNTVSPHPEYSRAAVRYFSALLDDRYKVGDGAGGDEVVHHDDGYSIRTRGCFGAIAYDWLHDAPGMTPELRRHARDRFAAWTRWFAASGYGRDQPIANYYVGWFGAVAFAGIAADGDGDDRMTQLSRDADRMYGREIVPAYSRKLDGGDFPEGWQYGDLVGAVLAIYADARTSASRSAFDDLPWLRQSVVFRGHALWPDAKHTLDTGDWSVKPAVAPAHALLALSAVLPPADAAARRARALARLASDPDDEWRWLVALGDDPSRTAVDPRASDPLSYVAKGTGTLTARSDASPQGVWVALTSAPSLSDHQHLDAGHFEIVRGADALVVDAGGYGSFSSLSHNVIVVDDHKVNDTYSPNQGTWGDTARIARYEDAGRFVYAVADYASAYDPAGYPADHPARSVAGAEREMIFSRAPLPGLGAGSARVVIHDRIAVTDPAYRVTFLLHGPGRPHLDGGGVVRIATGSSVALATTVLPAGVAPVLVDEPTNLSDGPYYANDPPEGTKSVRVEVRSPAGAVERRFLHAIVVAGAGARAPTTTRIDGDGVDGVAIDDEAYVFDRARVQTRAEPLSYRAPASATRHVVASLAPGARYRVTIAREGDGCRVSLVPGPGAVASTAGVVVLELSAECALR